MRREVSFQFIPVVMDVGVFRSTEARLGWSLLDRVSWVQSGLVGWIGTEDDCPGPQSFQVSPEMVSCRKS